MHDLILMYKVQKYDAVVHACIHGYPHVDLALMCMYFKTLTMWHTHTRVKKCIHKALPTGFVLVESGGGKEVSLSEACMNRINKL